MKHWIFLAFAALGLVACNGGPNQTNIEVITNMMDQNSIKAQDWVPEQGDKLQMRQPPVGTIARGHIPYAFANDPAGAEKQKNPYAGEMSAEFLTVGQHQYEIYCGLCHGATGAGDGRIAEKMAVKPRNLLVPESKAYTDGRIYHAIAAGKGVMGSYGSQITDSKKRWAIVNYVRTLQKQSK